MKEPYSELDSSEFCEKMSDNVEVTYKTDCSDLQGNEQYRMCKECIHNVNDWNGEPMCQFTRVAIEKDMPDNPLGMCFYCTKEMREKEIAEEPARRKRLGLWGSDITIEELFSEDDNNNDK